MEYKIDGAYTRVLRTALNKSWKNHPTNKELYGNILPPPLPISKSMRKQRLRFAGHYWRSKDELAGNPLLWRPSHGKQASGHPKITYVDQLTDVTGYRMEEFPNARNVSWKTEQAPPDDNYDFR